MQQALKKAKFITPPNKLKAKVGNGGLPDSVLEKAQNYINNNQVDFIPQAKIFLDSAKAESIKALEDGMQFDRNKLSLPTMQLKANGGMFRYPLLSEVANICLNFIEKIERMDENAYKVIRAHENAINIIIKHNFHGSGGKEGSALVKELEDVCKRYFSKHKS